LSNAANLDVTHNTFQASLSIDKKIGVLYFDLRTELPASFMRGAMDANTEDRENLAQR